MRKYLRHTALLVLLLSPFAASASQVFQYNGINYVSLSDAEAAMRAQSAQHSHLVLDYVEENTYHYYVPSEPTQPGIGWRGEKIKRAYSHGWPKESSDFQTHDAALAWTETQAATPGVFWYNAYQIVSDNLRLYHSETIDGKVYEYYSHNLTHFQSPGLSGGSGSCSAWSPGVAESRFGNAIETGHYPYGLDHMFPPPGNDHAFAGLNNCLVNGVYYRVRNYPVLRVYQIDIPNACPEDYTPSGSVCVIDLTDTITAVNVKDLPCNDRPGEIPNSVGNPCNTATGNKYQVEVDFNSNTGLSLTRHYNSLDLQDVGFGAGWTTSFHRQLTIFGSTVLVRVSNGRGEVWTNTGGTWTGDADSDIQLTEDATGFTITKANGDTDRFDLSGQLANTTTRQGQTTTYSYNGSGQLETVTGPFGHTIGFTYDASGHIDAVTDGNNQTYRYAYDANDNLISITYPDETPGNDADNPTRIYHYEDANFPNHLTGITDENGDRYATFAYDTSGKAISTEHAVTDNALSQKKFSLDYQ